METWTEAHRKTVRKEQGQNKIQAAEGNTWLYVGRLSPDTKEGDIVDYLP